QQLHAFPTRRSSDLLGAVRQIPVVRVKDRVRSSMPCDRVGKRVQAQSKKRLARRIPDAEQDACQTLLGYAQRWRAFGPRLKAGRSEEHTSELQSPYD